MENRGEVAKFVYDGEKPSIEELTNMVDKAQESNQQLEAILAEVGAK